MTRHNKSIKHFKILEATRHSSSLSSSTFDCGEDNIKKEIGCVEVLLEEDGELLENNLFSNQLNHTSVLVNNLFTIDKEAFKNAHTVVDNIKEGTMEATENEVTDNNEDSGTGAAC